MWSVFSNKFPPKREILHISSYDLFLQRETAKSPSCCVPHNGIGGFNAMTTILDGACRPTGTHFKITLLMLASFSLLFLSPLYLPHIVKSRKFSPLFWPLPLFWCVLSHSNPALAFFIMTKEQLRQLAAAGIHGNCALRFQRPLHRSSRHSLNPTRPPWLPPYLQGSSPVEARVALWLELRYSGF